MSHRLADFITNAPQRFWRYLGKSKEVIQKIKFKGEIVEDATSIAEQFNGYFRSVLSDLDEFVRCNRSRSFVHDITISREGVLNMLFKVDVRKSAGPDQIPNAFLRRYAEQICVF